MTREIGENAHTPADMLGNQASEMAARCHAEPDDLLPATHLASPPSTPLTTAAKRDPRFRVTNLLLT